MHGTTLSKYLNLSCYGNLFGGLLEKLPAELVKAFFASVEPEV